MPKNGDRNVFSFDIVTGERRQLSLGSGKDYLDLEPLSGGAAYLGAWWFFYPFSIAYDVYVSRGGESQNVFSIHANQVPELDYLHAAGERLVFLQLDRIHHQDQLWAHEPGAASAKKIATFYPRFTDHPPAEGDWPEAGGRLYFPATQVIGDVELWSTDGTAEGTRQVADVHEGPVGSFPHDLLALPGGRILFAATDRLHGDELFISDGTAAGTYLLADVAPGAESSGPSDLVLHGERLYFKAQQADGVRRYFYLDPPTETGSETCPQHQLCLGGDRFRVEVAVETADGSFAGRREHSQLDSGVFSFFSPGNWEMLVKVLDGCAINDRFWVFSAAATDVEYTLTVTDRANGGTFVHHHSAGSPAPALTEIEAFETCGLPPPEPQYGPTPPGPADAPVCGEDALCFGQLKLRVDWTTATGSGSANASPYGTAESGLFSFFSENNQEMLVKVLDACAINGHRWLLASAATDVEFTLKVRNSFNPNENRDYHHPGGSPAPAIIDLDSFGAGCGTP